ncbi:hypothetical protein QN277_024423 [Acacia crassicarpa]|uniref:Trimethylguanosine synthase n=1 Tax=Acacia crassicarpa TaxID=499986 RepID=A0AAE1MP24_9FABA|nr:hypothetical protein QN277_024423 [Acacia crassicarpa]
MATTKTSNPSKRRRVKAFRNSEASKEGITPLTEKYWYRRHNLFSKYDQGIQMDEEGWFSVTPEEIAIKHAERCTEHQVVIDAFCGVGGNAIQFARKGCHVIAIDIDPAKVAMAMNNAKVYGVEEYIDFRVGDFFKLAPSLKGDVVFLSPPWGGPSYKDIQIFPLELLKPADGYTLFKVARGITSNIIMFLPRNINLEQVRELCLLSSPPLKLEVEPNYVQNHHKGYTLYFRSQVAASPRFSSDSSGRTMIEEASRKESSRRSDLSNEDRRSDLSDEEGTTDSSSGGMNVGTKAGVVLGVIAAACVVVFKVFVFRKL